MRGSRKTSTSVPRETHGLAWDPRALSAWTATFDCRTVPLAAGTGCAFLPRVASGDARSFPQARAGCRAVSMESVIGERPQQIVGVPLPTAEAHGPAKPADGAPQEDDPRQSNDRARLSRSALRAVQFRGVMFRSHRGFLDSSATSMPAKVASGAGARGQSGFWGAGFVVADWDETIYSSGLSRVSVAAQSPQRSRRRISARS